MANELVGIWQSDPTDAYTLEAYGHVIMEFNPDGNLTYTIKEGEKDQIMLMTYEITGSVLITDQPSHPQKSSTEFNISQDILELYFDGVKSRYIRVTSY